MAYWFNDLLVWQLIRLMVYWFDSSLIYSFALFWFNAVIAEATDYFFRFRTVLIIMHPAIQPRLLWTIASHSNNPLRNINWNVSIIPETITPASSPFHQLSLRLNVIGSNRPMGNNSMQLSRFSFNSSRLWLRKNAFQDQNSSRLYFRSIGMRVNTVDPNTMPRKRRRIKPDMACDGFIFLLCSK